MTKPKPMNEVTADVLRLLVLHESLSALDIYKAIPAERLSMTSRFSFLVKNGLVVNLNTGTGNLREIDKRHYMITDEGREWVSNNPPAVVHVPRGPIAPPRTFVPSGPYKPDAWATR